jgi:hypothetical protein
VETDWHFEMKSLFLITSEMENIVVPGLVSRLSRVGKRTEPEMTARSVYSAPRTTMKTGVCIRYRMYRRVLVESVFKVVQVKRNLLEQAAVQQVCRRGQTDREHANHFRHLEPPTPRLAVLRRGSAQFLHPSRLGFVLT